MQRNGDTETFRIKASGELHSAHRSEEKKSDFSLELLLGAQLVGVAALLRGGEGR